MTAMINAEAIKSHFLHAIRRAKSPVSIGELRRKTPGVDVSTKDLLRNLLSWAISFIRPKTRCRCRRTDGSRWSWSYRKNLMFIGRYFLTANITWHFWQP